MSGTRLAGRIPATPSAFTQSNQPLHLYLPKHHLRPLSAASVRPAPKNKSTQPCLHVFLATSVKRGQTSIPHHMRRIHEFTEHVLSSSSRRRMPFAASRKHAIAIARSSKPPQSSLSLLLRSSNFGSKLASATPCNHVHCHRQRLFAKETMLLFHRRQPPRTHALQKLPRILAHSSTVPTTRRDVKHPSTKPENHATHPSKVQVHSNV